LDETGGGGRSGMTEGDAGVIFSAQAVLVKNDERPPAVECGRPLSPDRGLWARLVS
jgi:hypothetical protein